MTDNNKTIRGLILDMDGVLWRADQAIGNLPEIFSEFERRGYMVALATNNSTLTVQRYLDKLLGFGVQLQDWQIITSSRAAAQHLKSILPEGGPVSIIGEAGLLEAIQTNGFWVDDQNALAVVVGWDRQLTYQKLILPFRLILAGRPFIGTNPDLTYPTPEGLIPGTGSIIALLEAATTIKPVIVGKPKPTMYQIALERMQCSIEETLIVGDRLETDIVGAQAVGCRTAVVLSGVSGAKAVSQWRPEPDYVADDLQGLLAMI